LPLPLYGQNEMVITEPSAGQYVLTNFDNEFIGNVFPTWGDEILLADSLLFEESTKHFALIQLGTIYASWLYTGVLAGNQLTLLITFNPLDSPYYDYWHGQTTPPDPLEVGVLDLVGLCTFTAEE
jgi:hypothetical protein